MQLSEHFSLEELIASETAARKGIDNTPPEAVVQNLRRLAGVLERVRTALNNKPIRVNSGYRSPALNVAIGGSKTSVHVHGLAADIICPQFGSPLEVCNAIANIADLEFDQLIHEYGSWCHIGLAAPGKQARSQKLTIASAAAGYRDGLHKV